MIESKLLFGPSAAWLGVPGQRRLDGFQCSRSRRIARIPSAYVSRVNNQRVLERLGQERASSKMLKKQLLRFQRVAAASLSSSLRRATFYKEEITPITAAYVRKVGRPRHTWAEQLLQVAIRIWGSLDAVENAIRYPTQWKHSVLQSVF
jgi:hypothetical protein